MSRRPRTRTSLRSSRCARLYGSGPVDLDAAARDCGRGCDGPSTRAAWRRLRDRLSERSSALGLGSLDRSSTATTLPREPVLSRAVYDTGPALSASVFQAADSRSRGLSQHVLRRFYKPRTGRPLCLQFSHHARACFCPHSIERSQRDARPSIASLTLRAHRLSSIVTAAQRTSVTPALPPPEMSTASNTGSPASVQELHHPDQVRRLVRFARADEGRSRRRSSHPSSQHRSRSRRRPWARAPTRCSRRSSLRPGASNVKLWARADRRRDTSTRPPTRWSRHAPPSCRVPSSVTLPSASPARVRKS